MVSCNFIYRLCMKRLSCVWRRNCFSGYHCSNLTTDESGTSGVSFRHQEISEVCREQNERQPTFNKPSDDETEQETRQCLLLASIPFVAEHGWSREAIMAGAASLGLSSASHGIFPEGSACLVHYFYRKCNRELAESLSQKVRDRQQTHKHDPTNHFILAAVEQRLRMIQPYLSTWPQAMAIQASPGNAVESLKNLSRLVDDIWFFAGDRSIDFSWYTKRALLAALYKATEIYMVQDVSEDNCETWNFVERRISNLNSLGTFLRNSAETAAVMKGCVRGLRIVSRNMLGLPSRER